MQRDRPGAVDEPEERLVRGQQPHGPVARYHGGAGRAGGGADCALVRPTAVAGLHAERGEAAVSTQYTIQYSVSRVSELQANNIQ